MPRTRRRGTYTTIPRRAHAAVSASSHDKLGHSKVHLTDATEHTPKSRAKVSVDFFLQQSDRERIEGIKVLLEAVLGEIRVSFQHVNDYRSPRNDVPLLSFFVEQDKRANDVRTQPGGHNVSKRSLQDSRIAQYLRYQCSLGLLPA